MIAYGSVNSGLEPRSAEPFLVLLGLVALFPVSSDPLAKIPESRLLLWPLARGQRFALRIASLALSPVVWILLGILLWKRKPAAALAFLALAITVQGMVQLSGHVLAISPRWNLFRYVPALPGKLGGLVRSSARELLSVLDFYVAALLSLGGLAYRAFNGSPDPAAFPVLAVLVGLALSTFAQSLFGLEFSSGITRYRLLPLRGWEVLAAKDLAFLGWLFLLVLPLDVPAGVTAGLTALAFGHHSSVFLRLPQQKWRFTGGRLLPVGALQAAGCVALGMGEVRKGPVILAVAGAGYLLSLFWYGRCWDRLGGSTPEQLQNLLKRDF